MLVLNPVRDKDTRFGVPSFCPRLSVSLPFTLSFTASKELKEGAQNRRQIKRDAFQSTAPKLQDARPQNAKQADDSQIHRCGVVLRSDQQRAVCISREVDCGIFLLRLSDICLLHTKINVQFSGLFY